MVKNIINKILFEMLPTHFDKKGEIVLNDSVIAIQEEYDKLCPKPSQFPPGYEYFAIDGDYDAWFYLHPLKINVISWEPVIPHDEDYVYNGEYDVPIGLDWRLCMWSLKDAIRIHRQIHRLK